ncbi:MAG: hypothetical protein PQJ59_19025 [Spirochaetales bacterium]|nr:hypothetical protein [Spirochaetales bacterium]
MSTLRIHNLDRDLKEVINNTAKLKNMTPNELLLQLLTRTFEPEMADEEMDLTGFTYPLRKEEDKFEGTSLDFKKIDIEMWQSPT